MAVDDSDIGKRKDDINCRIYIFKQNKQDHSSSHTDWCHSEWRILADQTEHNPLEWHHWQYLLSSGIQIWKINVKHWSLSKELFYLSFVCLFEASSPRNAPELLPSKNPLAPQYVPSQVRMSSWISLSVKADLMALMKTSSYSFLLVAVPNPTGPYLLWRKYVIQIIKNADEMKGF